MIFYFSGTGNTKWIAEEMAKGLNDKTRNISDIKENEKLTFGKNDIVGIVFPVYAWSYPKNIEKFLRNLQIDNQYVFAIANCSSECGYSIKHINKIVKLESGYSISMPNNYIVSYEVVHEDVLADGYKDESKDIILEKIESAKERIKYILSNVKERKNIFDTNQGKLAFLKSTIANKMFNKYARNTKAFKCDKTLCNSCGLCEKSCPAKTIKIENSYPVWGETCYQCLSCIHRCPTMAINLGANTKNRNRYYIEKYL